MHSLPYSTLLSILILSSSISIFSQANRQTPYELLLSYDFPVGILPKGITDYEFDENTGKFSIFFKEDCNFNIFGYSLGVKVKYESTVKGYISKGRIYSMEGVSFNIWIEEFDIIEVTKNGYLLNFFTGNGLRWTFPAGEFRTSPQCGCGYECLNGTKSVVSDGTGKFLFKAGGAQTHGIFWCLDGRHVYL